LCRCRRGGTACFGGRCGLGSDTQIRQFARAYNFIDIARACIVFCARICEKERDKTEVMGMDGEREGCRWEAWVGRLGGKIESLAVNEGEKDSGREERMGGGGWLCKQHHTRPSSRLHARAVAAHDVAAPQPPPLEPARSMRGQAGVSGRAASSPAHRFESQGYPGAPNQKIA
jgi:hypothetical protein